MSYIKMDNKKHINGFTIVELLVVAVIIAILAVLGTVSYKAVMRSAVEAGLKADITSAESIIGNYLKKYNEYPYSFDANFCPLDSSSAVDTDFCLEPSSDNSYSAYTVNNSLNPPVYSITVTNANGISIVGGKAAIVLPATPITAIASTTGTTTAVGNIMTAGALTPAGATASYQWQSATTAGGTYTNISGATSSTYTLTVKDIGKYIKVVATGTGSYGGTQTSTASAVVSDVNWMIIGGRTWSKNNLNVGIMEGGPWNNGIVEKYCYGFQESDCTLYGGLYNYYEAVQYNYTEGAQGICPVFSHIPSDNELKTLQMSLSGMSQATADTTGWRGTDEGTKLKSGGSSGLNVPLNGRYHYEPPDFYGQGEYTYLVSSTQLDSENVWLLILDARYTTVGRNAYSKSHGYSVRCIVDNN